jgi:alpha-ketoglutarate-dependent taurine dioxygenase
MSTQAIPSVETDPLPYIVTPSRAGEYDLSAWGSGHAEYFEDLLCRYGAVLFRGFEVSNAAHFRTVFRSLVGEPLEYTERSSPRREVGDRVFTSTTYSAEREIYLHNEQSYNLHFPRYIAFFCETPAATGGETPLADTRKVLTRIDSSIVNNLASRGYTYVRNFKKYLGIPWREAFCVADADGLGAYCQANDVSFEWIDQSKSHLRTSQRRDVLLRHPITHEFSWFNHLTFFHPLTLDNDLRQLIEETAGHGAFPNATYYGDGNEIEGDVIRNLQDAYRAEEKCFSWEAGDVLIADNMLVAHGRKSFTGERRVLVCMAGLMCWSDVKISQSDLASLKVNQARP